MRPLGEADRAGIEAVLWSRVETSMFPLGNLVRHGMSGGHRHAMRFWGAGEPLEAVLGLAGSGMVLPQIPPALAGAAATALAGRRIIGAVGESRQVAALRATLLPPGAPVQLDREEALLSLDLSDLTMPATEGLMLAPLSAAPRDLLVRWRAASEREALGAGEESEAQAEADVAAWLAAGSQRVLLRGGRPVAMTGFNARLPGIVQVGAVWTPPELRRRGLARAAVALHLAEARAEGVERAILFTANPFAAQAYRALGFREVGRFRLLLLAAPQEVPGG
ncbi:GNAT family N-acetyltransferase [Rubellimicrobium roseum]|uniref:GNAT family N-acetyltransferase n=1 Tax=Rubellimicrobium roseum TaxID=687525 RepID=A0A5C4NH70_9RHOB|nr:GNAT family N-acetyltransferase [Rubellimicrobium roseum]TNC72376.1 GNAT family N-acetyltransferase [Rubellimicrobium roseum]